MSGFPLYPSTHDHLKSPSSVPPDASPTLPTHSLPSPHAPPRLPPPLHPDPPGPRTNSRGPSDFRRPQLSFHPRTQEASAGQGCRVRGISRGGLVVGGWGKGIPLRRSPGDARSPPNSGAELPRERHASRHVPPSHPCWRPRTGGKRAQGPDKNIIKQDSRAALAKCTKQILPLLSISVFIHYLEVGVCLI